ELRVHQIELEMQNEELRRTQRELDDSRAKYKDLYDLAPLGYLTFSPEGLILEANLAAARLLGTERSALVKQQMTSFILEEDQDTHYLYQKALLRTGEKQVYELRLLPRGGTPRWVRIEAEVGKLGNEEAEVCRVALSDITERVRAEEALRERDIRFNKLSSHVPGMIYQFMERPDGTYCVPFTTEAIKDIFGCSPQDVRDDFSPIANVIVPEDFDRFVGSIQYSAKHLTPWQCEYRVQIPGQSIRWLFGQSTPEKLADGGVIWHGFNTDITERKQADVELQKLASVVRYSSEMVNLATLDGKMIFLNEAGSKLLGIPPAEVERTHIMQVIPDPFKDKVENELMPSLINIGAWAGDLQYLNLQTGRLTDAHATTFVVKDPVTGTPLYLANVSTDITERKRAEEELRESEQRLDDIIDFLPDATFAINLKGEVIAWNRSMEELTGTPKEELIGKGDFAYAAPFYGETGPMLIDLIFQDREEMKENYDYLIKRRDQVVAEAFVPSLRGGKGAYLWGIASPLYDSSGAIVGAIESLRDITERKELEAAVERTQMDFLFAVSHELKTPLLIMAATEEMVELLPVEQRVERFREYADVWKRNLIRLRTIIDNLVDSQRSPRTGMKLSPQPTDLGALVGRVLEELAPLREKKGLRARRELDPVRPLSLDPEACARILTNLLTNAIKFSPASGAIWIGLREEADQAVLRIHDEGPGIPAEEMPNLFQPFRRGAGVVRAVVPGTGLGLYVSRILSEAQGGTIELESVAGRGATVTVRFPLPAHSA
ncbi:MAG: PAS domain S-box protein, partial [bacterium]